MTIDPSLTPTDRSSVPTPPRPVDGRVSPPRSPASSLSLRPGDRLHVYVEGRSGGFYTLRVGSHLLKAGFQTDLRPGTWYYAEVVRSGSTTLFRTLEQRPATMDWAALARMHSLPQGDAESVVRAFVQSGLPLQSERLALAWLRVRSTTRLSLPERARLAAVLEDKGLLDAPTLWERAVAAASGDAGNHDRRDGGSRPRERRLAEEIPKAFEGREEADDPLQLVNHAAGRGEHWIVVPLEFEGASDFSATVKMRFPRHTEGGGASGSFIDAVLDIRDAERRWTFGLIPLGDELRVVVLAFPEDTARAKTELARVLAPLQDRLRALGADFSVRLVPSEANDGFSLDDAPDIMRAVDGSA